MTKEELTRIRYIVLMDFPGNTRSVGSIKTIPDTFALNNKAREHWISIHEKYPKIYRRLDWWEQRQQSDMPKFVHYPDGMVYKLQGVFAYFHNEKGNRIDISYCQPASEEEYNSHVIKMDKLLADNRIIADFMGEKGKPKVYDKYIYLIMEVLDNIEERLNFNTSVYYDRKDKTYHCIISNEELLFTTSSIKSKLAAIHSAVVQVLKEKFGTGTISNESCHIGACKIQEINFNKD